LVETEKNLQDDQHHDIPFHAQGVLAADQFQYRMNGIGDQVQLPLNGAVPFPYFELPFQPGD
jgi:hypothetical protein